MPHIKRRANVFLILTIAAIFVLTAALILLMTKPAWPATPEPPQYSCEDVRRLIAEKGKVAAIAIAVEHGLSLRQIWQIRRTCKV
jgi:hypothetical protein